MGVVIENPTALSKSWHCQNWYEEYEEYEQYEQYEQNEREREILFQVMT